MSNPDAVPFLPPGDAVAAVAGNSAAPQTEVVLEYQPAADAAKPTESLKTRALRGSAWTIAGHGASQVLRFITNPILSRLLIPAHFGIMSIVGTFITGLQALSDVGIEHAIIQSKRGDDRDFLNTAWTLHIIRGFVLWILACALAWPLAKMYNQPILLWLMPAAGLGPLINGFNSTAMFTLNRHLDIGKPMILGIIGQVVSVVVTIALAWMKSSPWAIVGGGVASAIFWLIASHFLLPGFRNRFRWDKAAVSELINFGKWIMVSTLVTYWAMQIDRPLLGFLRDPSILGVYVIGLSLVNLPREVIGRLATVVLFPALARSAEDSMEDVGRRLLRARSLILSAALACSLGVVLGAPTFFHLLYKPEYHTAAWFAQLASISAWIALLQTSADRTFLAIGKPRTLVASNAANLVVTVIAGLVGLKLDLLLIPGSSGINGFMLGMAAGALTGHWVIQFALAREGINIFRQDTLYSATLFVLAFGGVMLQRWVATMGEALLTNTLLAFFICTPTCIWAALKIWKGIKR